MRKWIRIIVITLLLAGGIVLCAIRWQAWFGMPAEPKWTGDTLRYILPEPAPSEEGQVTALVLGDIHSRFSRTEYDLLAARVPDAQLIMQTGDWMDRGQYYYFQLLLREWTASKLCGLPVIACPGNHEYSKGLPRRLSPLWDETFMHPLNGPEGVPGASHWLDIAHARVIVIDTNPLDRLMYLTRTLTWLRQTMYDADGRFIIVLMHHPVLSTAKGRFNTLIYTAFRRALGDADLVLAGHDHGYMRRAPFVVLNAAGTPKPQRTIENADVADSVFVYGVLTLDSAALDLRIHRFDDGIVLDSLHVIHD